MAFNFDQMINKLQNGKLMTRPSWSNNQFLMATAFTNYILYCVPSNSNNPCSNYALSIADAIAIDWIEKT